MEDPSNMIVSCKECLDKMFPNKGKFDIEIGYYVKLNFVDKNGSESLWVEVTKEKDKQKENYEGLLSNQPITVKNIKYGDIVRFNKKDVLDVECW